MGDYQTSVFQWAAVQGEVNSLAIFLLGVCFTTQGYRFSRFLLAFATGVMAFAFSLAALHVPGVEPLFVALAVGAGLGLLAVGQPRLGTAFASIATFAALGYYLSFQCGLRDEFALMSGVVGAGCGTAALWLYTRPLPVVLTTIHGAALIVIGFVGLASATLPSMGATFVDWSSAMPAIVPTMLGMIFVTGYAFQANSRQGALETGSGRSWNAG